MAAPPSSPNPCNFEGEKQSKKNTLNSVQCPLSYPVLSHSEQDSLLSLSGPSDPCGPHPVQRSPEAQQVHTSRPETNLTSSKPSLILTSHPFSPCQGPLLLLSLCVCVCSAGIILSVGNKCVRVCVCVAKSQIR